MNLVGPGGGEGLWEGEVGLVVASCGRGPGELGLLAGHGILWAWYSAVGDALRTKDDEYLAALWQAGRTVTTLLRHEPDLACLMSRSVRASEALRLPAKHCSDTFLTFASKVIGTGIPPERSNMDRLKGLNLTYNAATLNFSMLAAVREVDKLDADTRSIIASIGMRFGGTSFP